jgi:hypothetical protein
MKKEKETKKKTVKQKNQKKKPMKKEKTPAADALTCQPSIAPTRAERESVLLTGGA